MADRRSTIDPRAGRRIVMVAGTCMALGALAGIALPAGLGWDFANFYDTGGRALHGQWSDLYDPGTNVGTKAAQGTMQFWGTPISAALYVPLALLPPYSASVLLKILDTLATAAGILVLFRWLQRRVAPDPEAQWAFAAIIAVLALLFQPFWTVYRVGGQTTPFAFLLLALAFVWYAKGRLTRTAAALVAVTVMKPAFVFIPAWLLLVSGRGFAVRFLSIGLASAAISVLVASWPLHVEFVQLMLSGLGVAKTWQYNSSLYVLFENLRGLPGYSSAGNGLHLTVGALTIALKGVVAVTLGVLGWRARKRELDDESYREVMFALALLFFLLFSQVVWEHYLAPLFIVIAHVWATLDRYPRGARILVGLVSLFALGQNLILALWVDSLVDVDTALEAVTLGLFKSAPLWLTLVFIWAWGREWLASFQVEASGAA